MRKNVEQLLQANRSKKLGNHKVEIEGSLRHFIYHWTEICTVDDDKRQFTTQNGGYATSSTTQAINGYKYGLESLGYKEVERL